MSRRRDGDGEESAGPDYLRAVFASFHNHPRGELVGGFFGQVIILIWLDISMIRLGPA